MPLTGLLNKTLGGLVAATFCVPLASTVSAQDDLNAKLRDMVTGYLNLQCDASDKKLQALERDDLNAALGILDLRVKCYTDTAEFDKAEAIMQAFERGYPKAFPTVSARYYLELKKGTEDSQANARRDVIGAHAAETIKDAEGDHLFLRQRVRKGEFLVEVREDLSFLKNGLYGRRYQYRVLQGMRPVYTVILGSSRVVENEIKEALGVAQDSSERFFHLDYFGDDGEIGPMNVYTKLPAYDTALNAVLATTDLAAEGKKPNLLKNHWEAARLQLAE